MQTLYLSSEITMAKHKSVSLHFPFDFSDILNVIFAFVCLIVVFDDDDNEEEDYGAGDDGDDSRKCEYSYQM